MKHLLSTTLFSLICAFSFGQGFVNGNSTYGISLVNTGAISHGAGVTFFDFNQDGFDDITFCSASDSLVFYESTGTGFIRKEIIPNNLDMRQASWADFDNDGDPDLLVTKARNTGNNTKLYRNDGYPEFTDVTDDLGLPGFSGVRSYGHTWGDYDKDGNLDLYICNYNLTGGITNWLFHNNGDGTFTELAIAAGVDNASHLSFQATFCDFNEDSWPDLYVVNDLDQTSVMFQNNTDGTFTEIGATNGTNLMIEAMCVSIDDFQQDDDWDIYVSNVATGNILLVNENGQFTNEASAANLSVNRMTWGTTWIDFDNDGDQDIHMVTTQGSNNQNPFFVNNGNNTFTENNALGFAGDVTNAYSNARGDFNNDGFYDLIHSTVGSQNSYIFWENIGVGGNYVKVDLQGTHSNADAIGSVVEYWVDGNKTRYITTAGEGFLSQNAHTRILGIADATAIDSLTIHWPRGLEETHYNLEAGNRYDFIEGETLSVEIFSETNVICEELTLDAGEWSSYLWEDGSESPIRTITEPGLYSVVVTNELGYPITGNIEITQGYIPYIITNITNVDCFGNASGSIVLIELLEAPIEINWIGFDDTFVPENLSPGNYLYEAISEDGCSEIGNILITEPDPIVVFVETTDALCFGDNNGSAIIVVTGGNDNFIWDTMGLDLNQLPANDYIIAGMDENGCEAVAEFSVSEPEELSLSANVVDAFFGANGTITLTMNGGTEPYFFEWSNGDQDNIAGNLAQGSYTCIISDSNGCTLNYSGGIIDLNISEFEIAAFEIYPNPATNFLTLKSTKELSSKSITISDSTGKIVFRDQILSSNAPLEISDLASGIYILSIEGLGKKKLIIE